MSKWKVYYSAILFFIFTFLLIEECKCDDLDEFDINRLFPSFQEKQQILNISDVIYKNVTIDIEKLDLPKYKQKLSVDLETKMQEELLDDVRNRSARRQVLHYTWSKGSASYFKASRHMTRQKTLDLILQLIYMARHKVQKLEGDPYYSKTDTGFRIGFLYRKLAYYLRLIKNVLGVMKFIHEHYTPNSWWVNPPYHRNGELVNHILLHQHAVKIHNDFLYLFWVSVNLDGKFRDQTNQKPVLPAAYKKDGGLTDDDELFDRPTRKKKKKVQPGQGPANSTAPSPPTPTPP